MNFDLLKYFATAKGLDAATTTFLILGWLLVEKKEWLALVCFVGAIASYVVTVIVKHDQAVKDLECSKKKKVAVDSQETMVEPKIKTKTK